MVKASTDADIPLVYPTISAPPHRNPNIPCLLLEALPSGPVNVVAEVARLKLGLCGVERRRRQLRCRLLRRRRLRQRLHPLRGGELHRLMALCDMAGVGVAGNTCS